MQKIVQREACIFPINEKYSLVIDYDRSTIAVMTPHNNPVNYEIPGGISPMDIQRIKEQVIINFNLIDHGKHGSKTLCPDQG